MSTPLAQVRIYTTRICPYCFAAKRLLDKKGVAYEEIGADGRADLRNWLIDASGQHTVPQIFINGQSIGGYDDMAELEKRKELDALLAAAPPPDLEPLPT